VKATLSFTGAAKFEGVQLVSVVLTCDKCGGEHLVLLAPLEDVAYMRADAWHRLAQNMVEADEVHKCRPRPAPVPVDAGFAERTPY
jgi:hypothetical protein